MPRRRREIFLNYWWTAMNFLCNFDIWMKIFNFAVHYKKKKI